MNEIECFVCQCPLQKLFITDEITTKKGKEIKSFSIEQYVANNDVMACI